MASTTRRASRPTPPQEPTPRTASQPRPGAGCQHHADQSDDRTGEHDGDPGIDDRQAARGAFTCRRLGARHRPRTGSGWKNSCSTGSASMGADWTGSWCAASGVPGPGITAVSSTSETATGSGSAPARARAAQARARAPGPARVPGSARASARGRLRGRRRRGDGSGLAAAVAVPPRSAWCPLRGVSAVSSAGAPRPPAARRPRWSRPVRRRPRAARLEAPSWWVPRPRAPRPSPPPQERHPCGRASCGGSRGATGSSRFGSWRLSPGSSAMARIVPRSTPSQARMRHACHARETTNSRTHIGGSGSVRVPDGITWSG